MSTLRKSLSDSFRLKDFFGIKKEKKTESSCDFIPESFKNAVDTLELIPKTQSANIVPEFDTPLISPLPSGYLSAFSEELRSPLDLQSPIPKLSYSLVEKDDSYTFQQVKLMEEMFESEETYVSSLKLLLNFYTTPMIYQTESTLGVTLSWINGLVSEMLRVHSLLVERLYQDLIGIDPHNIGPSIDSVCTRIKETISHYYLYHEYCNLFDDIFLLSQSLSTLDSSKLRLGGWNHYLEATQPLTQRLDLSFNSLIQRPTARYGKYRLILESMMRNSETKEEGIIVKQTLSMVKQKLELINTKTITQDSYLLEKLIDFDMVKLRCKFFGAALVIGSLQVIWLENDHLTTQTMGILLFKSHLILCEYRRNRPFTIKFMIPLAYSKLSMSFDDIDGGLCSKYPYTFKIIFEIGLSQYEVMFAAISRIEYEVWRSNLEVLINVVNGPYAMNYSNKHDGLSVVNRVTLKINPYDISLTSVDPQKRSACYFKRLILVRIYNEAYSNDNEYLAEYFNLDNNKYYDHTVYLSRHDKVKIEKRMAPVISKELPRLEKKKPSLTRHMSLINFESTPEVDEYSFINMESACLVKKEVEALTRDQTPDLLTPVPEPEDLHQNPPILRTSSFKKSIKRLFKHSKI